MTTTKTEKITFERTFTTEPKNPSHRRGNQTIRRNCIDFIEAVRKLGYKQVTLNQAKQIFEGLFGPRDRTTLKAYFGTMPGTSTRIIDKTTRYASGTVSQGRITLKQQALRFEGYLERLGLVSFNEYVGHWFLELNSEGSVVSELALSPSSSEGYSVGSNPDLSLTLQHLCDSPNDSPKVVCDSNVETTTTVERESSYRVRERKNIGKIGDGVPTPELSPQEEAILHAKPTHREEMNSPGLSYAPRLRRPSP